MAFVGSLSGLVRGRRQPDLIGRSVRLGSRSLGWASVLRAWQTPPMKRWWVLGVLGLVIVVAAVVGFVFLRNTTTPLTAADLGFTGTVGDAPGDPGIYVYETMGFEEVDALGGGRHDYPERTYLVIDDGDCGPVVRWQAIAERWDEWQFCGPDLSITRATLYHEWFHIPDRQMASCTGSTFPPAGETTWTTVCSDGKWTSTDVATVVGMESLVIGATSVETIHIKISSTTTGSTVGSTAIDEWRLAGTPLVVRKVVNDASANASRIGDIHYVEQVTLQLESLLPTG